MSFFAYAQVPDTGYASYYAAKFHGRPTASGELYHRDSLTAAHRSLSFGTHLKVTNLNNQKCVIVRVNDRGPFIQGRIIDLSKEAMKRLCGIENGVIKVKIQLRSSY